MFTSSYCVIIHFQTLSSAAIYWKVASIISDLTSDIVATLSSSSCTLLFFLWWWNDVEVVCKGFGAALNKNIENQFGLSHGLSSGLDRMYQRCCATYESASLRMFRLGRTDTIRSASNASAAFVQAFDDPSKQVWEKWFLPVSVVHGIILVCMVVHGSLTFLATVHLGLFWATS